MSVQLSSTNEQSSLAKMLAWLRYSYILFGVVGALAYFFIAVLLVQDIIYAAISLSAVVMICVGIMWNRPSQRRGWICLAIAQCCWFLGDALVIFYDTVFHNDVPFPSLIDPIYLTAYPFLIVGIYLLTRSAIDWKSRASLIDASIITVGVGALSWLFLIEPLTKNTEMEFWGLLVSLAYPLLDLLVFIMILRFVMLSSKYPAAFYFILIGLIAILLSDTQYVFAVMLNNYDTVNIFDLGWIIGYISLGSAALHPSMAYLQDQQSSDFMQLSRRRLFVIICSALIPSMALSLQYVFQQPYNIVLYISTTIILVILASLRLYGMMTMLDKTMAQVQYQALHDALTGLPNRHVFQDRLKQAYHRSSRKGAACAVLFLDLDGFKMVNDRWGHNLGDAVLIETAKRLQSCVRPGDTVARFGGDEFTVLIEEIQSIDDAKQVAERILHALSMPISCGNTLIKLNASIGIAVPEGEIQQLDELIRLADIAMYQAKVAGKGRYAVYRPDMLSLQTI